jgi:hypothetical protein
MLQFNLSSLFAAFVLFALSLAVFGPAGIVVGAILLGIVACVRIPIFMSLPWWYLVLTVIGGLLLLCLPLLHRPIHEPNPRAACMNNLKQIGLALLVYNEVHGTLPPVRECDAAGKPLHSWRVLLLPHLDEDKLFRQYTRGEAWDGPNNRKLASSGPSLYRCPSDRENGGKRKTDYVAVVGADGDWLPHGTEQNERRDLNPVFVVEACDLDIAWMEPRDISLEDLCKPMPDGTAAGLSSKHTVQGHFFYYDQAYGGNAVFADGSVRSIPPGVPADLFRAALLGDRDKQEELDAYQMATGEVHWPNCIALASLVACFVLMLAWPRKRLSATRWRGADC